MSIVATAIKEAGKIGLKFGPPTATPIEGEPYIDVRRIASQGPYQIEVMTRWYDAGGRAEQWEEFVTINPIGDADRTPPVYSLDKYVGSSTPKAQRFWEDRWVDPERSLRAAIRGRFSRN